MKKIVLLLAAVSALSADPLQIFPYTQHRYSTQSMGFGGGGSAVIQGPGNINSNPATLSTWSKLYKLSHFTTISNHDIGDMKLTTISHMYSPHAENSLALSVSFGKDSPDQQRFLSTNFALSAPIAKEESRALSLGVLLSYNNLQSEQSKELRDRNEHLAHLNISLLQFETFTGNTFGITLENILAYQWIEGRVVYSEELPTQRGAEGRWTRGTQKSILLSGASRIPIDNTPLIFTIPVDMRFWGFLSGDDRKSGKLRNRVDFYTGLEFFQGGKLGGRFGYSWKTLSPETDDRGVPIFENTHNYSFGASLNIGRVLADVAVERERLGFGLTLGL